MTNSNKNFTKNESGLWAADSDDKSQKFKPVLWQEGLPFGFWGFLYGPFYDFFSCTVCSQMVYLQLHVFRS